MDIFVIFLIQKKKKKRLIVTCSYEIVMPKTPKLYGMCGTNHQVILVKPKCCQRKKTSN